jgi:hypothetical protein
MEDDGQLHASAALLASKEPSLIMEKDDGWALEQMWSFGEEKNLLPMIELETGSVRNGRKCSLQQCDWTD